jgi:hypothetical protein
MRRFPRFTDVESERLVEAAVEVLAKRCSADSDYLRSFLRDYLGIAEAAVAPVYERCQQDHSYLRGIVRDYVLGSPERAVLELLQRATDSKSLAERLGFDPRDPLRAEAYRRATRWLDRRQKVVLLAALGVSLVMLLLPPQVEEHWRTSRRFVGGGANRVQLLESRFIGYGPWRRAHTDVEPEGPGLDHVLGYWLAGLFGAVPSRTPIPTRDGQETVYRLNGGLFVLQFLLVWGLSVLLLVVLRNKKRSYSDYLLECGASRLPAQTGGHAEAVAPADRAGIKPEPLDFIAQLPKFPGQ